MGEDERWPWRGARDVCWMCGGRLIWDTNDSDDDDPDTITTYLHCSDCGADVRYVKKEGNDEGNSL